MSNSNKIEQVIEFVFKGGTKAERALGRLENKFNKISKAAGVNTKEINKNNDALNKLSDQGMFNIQAGMVQLSTYSMIMNQKVNNAFDKMQNSFKKAENSLTQLKIKMGMTLNTAQGSKITQEYKEMETEIKRLAATTKFTIPEVADAFNKLVGTGLSAKEAIKALVPTLKFVSASAGAIDLSQGVEAAKLSTTTLNGDLEDLGDNLNNIFVATQKTSLSFENVTETFTGLKSSFASFKKDKDLPLALIGLSSAMASVGMVGREGGDKINQFSGALNNMFKLTERGEFMGFDRRNVNRKNMLRFFGLGDVGGRISVKLLRNFFENFKGKYTKALKEFRSKVFNVGEEGELTKKASIADFVTIPKATKSDVELFRDNLMKDLLTTKGEDGKRALKGATELMSSILKAYDKAVEKEGEGVVSSYVSSALGGAKGTKLVMQALKKQMDASGAETFADYLDMLRAKGDKLGEAQKMALDTVEGQTALLESAYDSMFQSLMGKDVFGKEALKVHRDLISTLDVMLKKYPSLAQAVVGMGRAFQVFTGIATNLGFALTAMATLSMGLTYASKATGRGMKGLGNILGSFRTIFLAPTLSVLMSLVGGFALAGVALVALMKHFTGAKSIGEGFSKTMDTISVKVKGITGLFKLSMAEGFAGKSATDIVKEYQVAQQKLTDFQMKHTGKLNQKLKDELAGLQGDVNKFREAMGGDDVFGKFKENTDTSLTGLALVTDKLLELKGTLVSLFDGIVTGMSPFIGAIVAGFEQVFTVITAVVRAVGNLFGLFSDSEGSSVAMIMGTLIGGLLGIKIFLATIVGSFTAIIGLWTGIGNKISRAKGFMQEFNAIQNKPITTYGTGLVYKENVKKNIDKGLAGKTVPNFIFGSEAEARERLKKDHRLSSRRMRVEQVATGTYAASSVDKVRLAYHKLNGNVEQYDRIVRSAADNIKKGTYNTGRLGVNWDRIKTGVSATAGILGAVALVGGPQLFQSLGASAEMAEKLYGYMLLSSTVMTTLALQGITFATIGAKILSVFTFLGSVLKFVLSIKVLIFGAVIALGAYILKITGVLDKIFNYFGFGGDGEAGVTPKNIKSPGTNNTKTKQKVNYSLNFKQENIINAQGHEVGQKALDSLNETRPTFMRTLRTEPIGFSRA